jgi:hypothetical protein
MKLQNGVKRTLNAEDVSAFSDKGIYDFKRILNNLPVLHIFGIENIAICFQCGGNNNSIK